MQSFGLQCIDLIIWSDYVSQQSMSKREIEDLLRKGAYGAIMEEENDDSSK